MVRHGVEILDLIGHPVVGSVVRLDVGNLGLAGRRVDVRALVGLDVGTLLLVDHGIAKKIGGRLAMPLPALSTSVGAFF